MSERGDVNEREGLALFINSLDDAEWRTICDAAGERLKAKDPSFNGSEWDRLRFDYYGCIVLEATYRAGLLAKP